MYRNSKKDIHDQFSLNPPPYSNKRKPSKHWTLESSRIETYPILSHGKLPIVSCNCNIIIRHAASDNGQMFLITVWGPKPMKICFHLTGNCEPINPWELVNPVAFHSESDGVISWFVVTSQNEISPYVIKCHHPLGKTRVLPVISPNSE